MNKSYIKLVVLIILIAGASFGWYLFSPLILDQVVNEESPVPINQEPTPAIAPTPELITQGSFQNADSFHKGSGQALIYKNHDGSYLLRFENFEVTNGPDLKVFLSGHKNPTNSEELHSQGALELSDLKGNIGDQNYIIPAGSDLSAYQSVVIYCKPFKVIFSVASL